MQIDNSIEWLVENVVCYINIRFIIKHMAVEDAPNIKMTEK
jgi:hypothetical protein